MEAYVPWAIREEVWLDSSQRSCSRQQLAAAAAVYATFSIGPIESHAKAGAGFIGNCMKREQRLAQARIVSFGQLFERHLCSLAKDFPLLSQKIGKRPVPIFHPNAPLPARLLDCVRPVSKPKRRPMETVMRRKDKPICF